MKAYYATVRFNGVYCSTTTVRPGQSIARRAILSRLGLGLKNHTVELCDVDGNKVTAV